LATIEDWLSFCDRLYAKGVDVFNGAEVPLTDDGPRESRVVALTLLARTLSNMKAAVLLIENGQVVEARIIGRAAYENMFYATALLRRGAALVDALELDDITSRRKRATGLLEWARLKGQIEDDQTNLEAFRDKLVDDHGKTSGIVILQAAVDGGVGESVIIYRELSSDAAHPTAASLSRHVSVAEDGADGPPFTLHATPLDEALEPADTLELLTTAVLGAIVAVNELLGGIAAGERLDDLAGEAARLSASNKADRERD